jgi:hypothetical protein
MLITQILLVEGTFLALLGPVILAFGYRGFAAGCLLGSCIALFEWFQC